MVVQLGHRGGFTQSHRHHASGPLQLKVFPCKTGLRTAVAFIDTRPHSTQLPLGCFVESKCTRPAVDAQAD